MATTRMASAGAGIDSKSAEVHPSWGFDPPPGTNFLSLDQIFGGPACRRVFFLLALTMPETMPFLLSLQFCQGIRDIGL
jgi:hypothetical protein